MHAALLPNGNVVFLDKVEDYTQVKLANGYYAYSSEYDPIANQVVPLSYKTNAFCAGGAFLANGTLLSVGGNAPLTWLDPTVSDGFQGLRYLTRSATDASLDGDSWVEPGNQLNTKRWYPSVQTLPDGRIFVASGSLNGLNPTVLANNNPTYEILDANGVTSGQSITMELLVKAQPYYMYAHLLASRPQSILIQLLGTPSSTSSLTAPSSPSSPNRPNSSPSPTIAFSAPFPTSPAPTAPTPTPAAPSCSLSRHPTPTNPTS